MALVAGVATASAATGRSAATCTAGEVAARAGRGDAAVGTVMVPIVLRNHGTRACTLRGYAGLRLLGPSGPLPTRVQHGGLALLERPVQTVTLAPGQKATILVAYTDVPTGAETSCPTGTGIRVQLPGGGGALRVSVETNACAGGLLRESPVLPGVVAANA